jgi:hypothetical protein
MREQNTTAWRPLDGDISTAAIIPLRENHALPLYVCDPCSLLAFAKSNDFTQIIPLHVKATLSILLSRENAMIE